MMTAILACILVLLIITYIYYKLTNKDEDSKTTLFGGRPYDGEPSKQTAWLGFAIAIFVSFFIYDGKVSIPNRYSLKPDLITKSADPIVFYGIVVFFVVLPILVSLREIFRFMNKK